MTHTAQRYHDLSCGHRVAGHENKCAHLHGHNYRIHFICEADSLDGVGRVIDFSSIKDKLCSWVEQTWDHRFLVWEQDPMMPTLHHLDPEGVFAVPFNPTAENMAQYLVDTIGPLALRGTGVKLVEVTVEETRKCSATYKLEGK